MSAKPLSAEPASRKTRHKGSRPNRKKKEPRSFAVNRGIKIWGSRICGLVLLALGLIFIHDLITQSAYFQIRSIRILGADHLDEESIVRQTAIPEKANLLALNLHLTRLRLESHPWIHKAALKRRLPDTLEIRITEEKAYAILLPAFIPETAFWADREGRIFKEVEAEDPEARVRIEGLPMADAEDTKLWFAKACTLLDLLEAEPDLLGAPPFTLWVDPDIGLGLVGTDIAGRILFGFSDYRTKTTKLRALLQYRRTRKQTEPMDTIDLVRPDRVVVIPAAA